MKKSITLSLLSLLLSSYVYAANPPAPFSPSDNVLDPGCLPTDSNCYVSISTLNLTAATSEIFTVTGQTTLGNASTTGLTSSGILNVLGKTTLGLASTTALTANTIYGALVGTTGAFSSTLNVSGNTSLTNASTSALSVSGLTFLSGLLSLVNASSTGGITASTFYGAGTGLTGIAAGLTAGAISSQGTLATLNAAPAGTLTGTTLAAGVTSSSLTSLGTLTSLTVSGQTALGNASSSALTVSGQTVLGNASSTNQSLSGNLFVNGQTKLANASTTGLSSSGSLNVTGKTTLGLASTTALSVSGATTLGTTTINGQLALYGGTTTLPGTLFYLTQAWDNPGATFSGLTQNILRGSGTTASSSGLSKMFDFQENASSVFYAGYDDGIGGGRLAYVFKPSSADAQTFKIIPRGVNTDPELSSNGNLDVTWSGDLRFSSDGLEKMLIDNNGNIGIGSSTINYTGWGGHVLSITSDDDTGIEIASSRTGDGTPAAGLTFVSTANDPGQMGVSQIMTSVEGDTAGNQGGTLDFWTKPDNDDWNLNMKLTGTGNLGIGTTSPLARLQVDADGTGPAAAIFTDGLMSHPEATIGGYNSVLTVGLHNGDNNYQLGYISDAEGGIANYQTTGNTLNFDHYNTDNVQTGSNYLFGYGGFGFFDWLGEGSIDLGVYSRGDKMLFGAIKDYATSSNNIPNLVIDTVTGNVGIGTTSPEYLLHVGSTTVSGVVARFQNSSGYCDINPTTTSLTCTSDERLKKNIVSLDASTTLNNLRNLHAVDYNWLNENDTSSSHAGFIAQQVKPLFPDLVSTDQNGTLSVSYGGFIPYIIQSIQAILTKMDSWGDQFTTKKLCVTKSDNTEVCVTGDELDSMLQSRGQTGFIVSKQPSQEVSSSTNVDEDDATSTGSTTESTPDVPQPSSTSTDETSQSTSSEL